MPEEKSRAQERSFVEQLKRRDDRAWAKFLDEHRDRIYGLCLRMVRDPHIAEELSSEAFKRVVRGIASFRGESSLGTWLFRITHNLCLTWIAKRRAEGQKVDIEELDATGQSIWSFHGAEAIVHRREQARAIERALASLEPEFRIAIHLREIEGLSYAEIAEVMAIPIDTVKTRIHRARQKLALQLEEFRP